MPIWCAGLREAGAEVRVVMTEAATEFITELTLQAVSGQPVHRRLLDTGAEAAMAHKGAHDLFLQDLQALSAELDEVGLTEQVNEWVHGRMTEWITFHIRTNDLPLGRHLARLRHRSGAAPTVQKSQQS